MSGFQFVHVQQFSRKPVAGKAGADGVTRGGRAGVRGVLAEAARAPGAALHVERPRAPVLVAGLDPPGVEALHDARVDAARCEIVGGRSRAVRQDQATLLTVVASYPATVAECEADSTVAAARDAWQDRNLAWLRGLYGDQLVGVIRHDDEAYPHLHAYVLPGDPAMRANALHPGWSAKQAAKGHPRVGGLDPKSANALGDRAYREAMRALQDGYWQAVGLPSGLTRVGPGRRRLTRDAWQAEQSAVGATAHALGVAGTAWAEVAVATAARVEAESRAAALAERGAAFVIAARVASARARVEADAATGRLVAARDAEAASRLSAAAVLQTARRVAAGTIKAAESRAVQARGVGVLVGAVWAGLIGVRRCIEAAADRQVQTVRRDAASAVKTANMRARAAVAGEIDALEHRAIRGSSEARDARHALDSVHAALRLAECRLVEERVARQAVDRDCERFRRLWADADNALAANAFAVELKPKRL